MSSSEKYKILLIEPSEIIAAGFKAVVSKSVEFQIVNTLSNRSQYTPTQSHCDIIVINPAVINYNERFDIRSYFSSENEDISIVALTNSGYEENVMRQYDGCINIYDNSARIVQKLHSAIEEAKQLPKNELNELSI